MAAEELTLGIGLLNREQQLNTVALASRVETTSIEETECRYLLVIIAEIKPCEVMLR